MASQAADLSLQFTKDGRDVLIVIEPAFPRSNSDFGPRIG
jgi:hypothetical protein